MIMYGLDISTKTGLVALECNKFGQVPTVRMAQVLTVDKGIDRIQRADLIADQMLACIDQLRPDRVMVENYGFKNAHTLALLVEIGTILRYFLYQLDIPYDEITPNSVKKFVTGHGGADKKQMAVHSKKLWGFEHKSNDVVDAHGLAMYGLGKYGLLKMTDYQIESLV